MPQGGRHVFIHDAPCFAIRQGSFEPKPHFHAKLSFLHGDQDEHAIVFLCLANAPAVCQVNGIILHALPAKGGHRYGNGLRPRLLLQRPAEFHDLLLCLR